MEIASSLLELIVRGFFLIITKSFDILFFPIIAVIVALFPDLSSIVNDIFNFLNTYIVPYIQFIVSSFIHLTHINPFILQLLIGYYVFMFTGKHVMVAVNFALNVYNKLKP